MQGQIEHKQLLAEEMKSVEEIIESQQNYLLRAETCLQDGDSTAFYNALNEGLKNYLSKKLSIAPEYLNKKSIIEQLDKKGITNETAVQLNSLIDEIEYELYTPFSKNEKMKEMYDSATDVIQLLNTYHG